MSDSLRLISTPRFRLLGRIVPCGVPFEIERGGRGLGLAAGLCETKQARPGDEQTAREIELAVLIRRADRYPPRSGPKLGR